MACSSHSRASHALLTAAQPPSVDDDRPSAGDEDEWTLAREEAAQVLADSIEEGWYAWWREPRNLKSLHGWLVNQGRTPPESFWTVPWVHEDAWEALCDQENERGGRRD